MTDREELNGVGRMLWLLFAIFGLQPTVSFSIDGAEVCATRIAMVEAATLWKGLPNLMLAPRQTRYLIGSLVHTEDGQYLLAVGGYRTRHESLHGALDAMAAEGEIKPFRYLWLGELKLENENDDEDVGHLTAINEIAGYYRSALRNLMHHENNLENLLSIFSEHSLLRVDDNVRKLKFDPDSEDEHLMPELNEFKRKLEKLKSKNRVSQKETYRHYIGNALESILGKVTIILENDAKYPSQKKKVKALNEIFDRPLVLESLSLYVKWLQNDGISHPSIEKIAKLADKLNRKRVEDLKDWWTFQKAANRWTTWLLSSTGDSDLSVPDWMAFGGVACEFKSIVIGSGDLAQCAGEVQVIDMTNTGR